MRRLWAAYRERDEKEKIVSEVLEIVFYATNANYCIFLLNHQNKVEKNRLLRISMKFIEVKLRNLFSFQRCTRAPKFSNLFEKKLRIILEFLFYFFPVLE